MKRLLLIIGCMLFIIYILFVNRETQQESQKILERIPKIIQDVTTGNLTPSVVPQKLTTEHLFEAINNARALKHLPVYSARKELCTFQNNLDQSVVKTTCPYCKTVVTVGLDSHISSESALLVIEQASAGSAILTDANLEYLCITSTDTLLNVVAASIQLPPKATPSPTYKPVKNISEDELWNALMVYRQTHKMSDLTRDEKLCEYARKRVNDHIQMLDSNKPKETYPVPSKYPLDAHDGFKKDADSGYVFEITGKQRVAENLAYWPNAEYATHVIEWGWDSSTEGHRETQLSNDYATACLTGKQGFFVAIYGR